MRVQLSRGLSSTATKSEAISHAVRAVSLESLEPRRLLSTNVTTYHNDNVSSGANLTESLLTPGSVKVATFAKQFSTPVDGQVYAQPLYVAGVNITAGRFTGVHDVAFVATQHDGLYAIDAHGGNIIWQL